MAFGDGMGVSVRVGTPALEVLPADETGVNVYSRQRDGAKFLEVEVEELAVYRVEIWT